MLTKTLLTLLIGSLPAMAATAPTCPARQASSGPRQAALLELYTSEGCSSCPPADRWLSSLRTAGFTGQQLVPLAFHVDYWDNIGWPDRFADPRNSQRQRNRAAQTRQRVVFTPQMMLNSRNWSESSLVGLRQALDTQPASRTDIHLQSQATATGLAVNLQVASPAGSGQGQVYVVLTENGLSSQVKAGENAGATLRHDYVVRTLLGPWPLDNRGALSKQLNLPLLPGQQLLHSGVSAWVEEPDSGRVLQALALSCDSPA